jgi:integrase
MTQYPNFSAVAAEWLQSDTLRIKPMTRSTYEQMLTNRILPALGGTPVDRLTPKQIGEFVRKNSAELSASSANIMGCALRGILRYSAENYTLEEGCLESARTVLPRSRKEIRVLSRDEQKRLEAVLEGDNPRRIGVLLTLYTGLRIGEVCALKWGDFSQNYSTMHINSAVQLVKSYDLENGGTPTSYLNFGTPKSASSIRTIPVPDKLIARMEPIRADPECFVLSGTETVVSPEKMNYVFRRALEQAGIEWVKFHTLRHTFATRWVEHGFDVKALSRILGHADVATTMNIYVHPSLDTMRDLINQL